MKRFLAVSLSILLIVMPAAGAGGYRKGVVFQATETPMSQGGIWIQGGATGLDWHNVNMDSAANLTYGTQPVPGPSCTAGPPGTGCDDSAAILTGSWPDNQMGCGIVHTTNQQTPNSGTFEEVEILLRSTITAHSITQYEMNTRVVPGTDGSRYVQMGSIDGARGNFTGFASTLGPGLAENDLYCSRIVGSTITTSINGVDVLSHTVSGADPVYHGAPGMGFYFSGGPCTPTCGPTDYGFKYFVAGTAVASCSTTDLQNAINAASDGDVLMLPPCTNNAFNTNVTVPDTKNLWIIGQGQCTANCGVVGLTPTFRDSSTISGSGRLTITSGTNLNNYTRISGITTSNDEWPLFLANSAAQTSWLRMDNVHYRAGGPWISARTYGVLDHCYFSSTGAPYTGMRVFESAEDQANGSNYADGGGASWARADSLGTADAMYFETCSGIAASPGIGISIVDGRSGARIGIRYSYFKNWTFEMHDAEIAFERGTRNKARYFNTWDYTSNIQASAEENRGGVEVAHDECYRLTNSACFTQTGGTTCPPDSPGLPEVITLQRAPGGVVTGNPWNLPSSPACPNTTASDLMCVGKAPKGCADSSTCTADFAGVCKAIDIVAHASSQRCRDAIGMGQDDPSTGLNTPIGSYWWNRKLTSTASATPAACSGGSSITTLNVDKGGSLMASGTDYFPNTAKPGYTDYPTLIL